MGEVQEMTRDKGHEAIKREFAYYLDNQDDFVKKYDGKVIALKDHKVLGAYDSYIDALVETTKEYEQGTFMLQRVSEGDEEYTVTIHTPVFPP